ncbi:hypothetical protein GCM10011611_35720 [Aliidongia dinghuensis]|uniref:histidine kinase n=1 Tax=Aliidongia dinghuensis TaxID=1867774 RepID=A0A8J3E4E1_9PROT|nr:ATP-binding protein [Aliidongia dinghuensis]GGF26523.1 hypothetical protein GCM10011611_35720 [Aliidongia dinghuensis]
MESLQQERLEQYAKALRAHLTAPGELELNYAYEFGRVAMSHGLGVLDTAILYHTALKAATKSFSRAAIERSIDMASEFLAESLSPFEMQLRGYQESNARLTAANEALQAANDQLARQAMELAANAAQLALARTTAEAASESKSQFLAVMSHELRTPLTALIGFSELLLQENFTPDELRRYLNLQYNAGRTLLALVNDILDFSKIEAGRLELESVPVDLRAIVRDCEALMRPAATAKGLALRTHVDVSVPDWLASDPVRLRQVILNLLTNAVKFTDVGAVEVAVGTVRATDDSKALRITIADSGIGISAEELGHLFQAFSQLSSGRHTGGTGLGLAICRRLVEAMGGIIGVDSAKGRGSIFWFEVPLVPAEAPTATPTAPRAAAAAPTRRRVLVADDDIVLQSLIEAILEKAGHTVQIVDNGEEAVRAMTTAGPYDVLVIDIQMPVMDGIEAIRRIRAAEAAAPGASPVPIIALTATATVGERERCLAAGASGFLAKPFDLELLVQAVSAEA